MTSTTFLQQLSCNNFLFFCDILSKDIIELQISPWILWRHYRKRVEEWTEKLGKLYFRTVSGDAVFKRIKTIRNSNFSVNHHDKELFYTHTQCFKVCHKGLLWIFIAYLKAQWILNFDSFLLKCWEQAGQFRNFHLI